MFYHRRLLNHFLHINEWLAKQDAQADLNMRTFQVTVRQQDRHVVLEPQFLFEKDDILAYAPRLTPNVSGFIGWLPYRNKRWPLAQDKLLFKQYVEMAGKRTPQYWLNGDILPTDVLIKPAAGSFGAGQRGPFRTIDPSKEEQRLGKGEFYERFTFGRILKAWYWNDTPICLELRDLLMIEGDGRQSVEELIRNRYAGAGNAWRRYKQRRAAIEALLAFQGATWVTVLPAGRRLAIDYLYGSSLYPDLNDNANQLSRLVGTALHAELLDCGPVFYRAIPEDIRANTMFVVDGIVDDATGQISWLEMNSNPMLPPDGYAPILHTLFKE